MAELATPYVNAYCQAADIPRQHQRLTKNRKLLTMQLSGRIIGLFAPNSIERGLPFCARP
jgi:hypothetical protein